MKTYVLTLTLKGPVLFQAAGTKSLGLDSAIQRYRGIPCFNGSQLKGNIRHTLNELAQLSGKDGLVDKVTWWFGKGSTNDYLDVDGFLPHRGAVQFDLFWIAKSSDDKLNHRIRIEINEHGGTESGALQVIEDAFPFGGDDPIFEGRIQTRFESEQDEKDFIKWLDRALAYIPALGSNKGIGFGRLIDHDISEIRQRKFRNSKLPQMDRVDVLVEFDRPICVGRLRTPDSNQVFSEVIIPGAVLKGAIAANYGNDSEALEKYLSFDQLRISHLKPVEKLNSTENVAERKKSSISRPCSIPLSTGIVGNKIYDFSYCEVEDVCSQDVPMFRSDWKEIHEDLIRNEYGIGREPTRMTLVRTAINVESHTAQTGELFSFECVEPGNHKWHFSIDLTNVPDKGRKKVLSSLSSIFSSGIWNVGKTAAACSNIEWRRPATIPTNFGAGDTVVVTLQTAACLFSPGLESRVNAEHSVNEEYQSYWSSIDRGNHFELIRFYAEQERAGGGYYRARYQKSSRYSPVWLTREGSVFVVKILDKSGAEQMRHFAKVGLPPALLDSRRLPTWQDSPYLAENGYGEILVDWQPQIANAYVRSVNEENSVEQ